MLLIKRVLQIAIMLSSAETMTNVQTASFELDQKEVLLIDVGNQTICTTSAVQTASAMGAEIPTIQALL